MNAITAAGARVILIEPGGKVVVDMRTDKEREHALTEWNDANPNDQREKAPSGVYTSSGHVATLLKYVRRYVKPVDARRTKGTPAGYGDVAVNFGLHLGPSGLIVVDADRPAEVDAFRTWYAANAADGDVDQVPGATVLTPGTLNRDGSYDHHDGGHWYFVVPELVDLAGPNTPAGRTIAVDPVEVERVTGRRYTGEGVERTTFAVKTGNSYVVIPPSVRDAGPYVFNMPDDPAPLALIDAVTNVEAITSSGPNYSDAAQTNDVAVPGALVKPGDDDVVTDPEGVSVASSSVRPDDADRNSTSAPADTGTDDVDDHEPVVVPGGFNDDDGTLDDRLADWSAATPWHDVLTPSGWTTADRADDCGCDIWTRPHDPGESPTPKSLTAHDAGCSRGRVDPRHPAAHVWSDHVDGPLGDLVRQRERDGKSAPRTVSKFSVYAALRHDGDYGEAVREAGVGGDAPTLAGIRAVDAKAERDAVANDPDREGVEATRAPVGLARREGDTALSTEQFTPPRPPIDRRSPLIGADGRDILDAWQISTGDDAPADNGLRAGWPSFGSLNDYRDVPPPGWILDNVLQMGGLNAVIGDSGSGKSAVVLDLLCTIAAGVGSWHGTPCASFPVVYVAGEGFSGAVARARSWEKVNGHDVGDRLYIVNEPISLTDTSGAWGALAYYARQVGAGMIVVDTLARSTGGLDENSAGDMSAAVKVFDKLRTTTGASVVMVHHTTRGTSHARGSTSLKGALDSEVLVRRADDADQQLADGNDPVGDLIEVSVVKQKNGPDDFVIDLALADRAAALHMNDDGPYPNDQRLDVLRGKSSSASYQPTGDLAVTSPEGRPAAYVATFGTPSAAVIKRPLPPLSDTADRIVDFVESLDNVRPTKADIEKATTRPVGVDASAKAWSTHVFRAIDEALSEGREPSRRIVANGSRFIPYEQAVVEEW